MMELTSLKNQLMQFLFKSDIAVLEKGIIEGKTYYNMMKYIKITTSSNFGNMFALLFVAIFFTIFAYVKCARSDFELNL